MVAFGCVGACEKLHFFKSSLDLLFEALSTSRDRNALLKSPPSPPAKGSKKSVRKNGVASSPLAK